MYRHLSRLLYHWNLVPYFPANSSYMDSLPYSDIQSLSWPGLNLLPAFVYNFFPTFPYQPGGRGKVRANCLSSLSLQTDKQISADIRACDWAGDVTSWIRTSGGCCIPSIPPLSENFPSGGWERIILVCVLGQRNLELSLIVTGTRWPSFQHFGELATNTHWLLPSVEVS